MRTSGSGWEWEGPGKGEEGWEVGVDLRNVTVRVSNSDSVLVSTYSNDLKSLDSVSLSVNSVLKSMDSDSKIDDPVLESKP